MLWRIATFNVNGIRARLGLVKQWLAAAGVDVVALQETKVPDEAFPAGELEALGYQAWFWGQKAYNGVAILTTTRPQEFVRGMDGQWEGAVARVVAVRLGRVWVVNTYVPQGRAPDDPAFEYKLEFLARLRQWFSARFSPAEPLVWMGDVNVAPGPEDVFDPQRLEGQVGYHPRERQALQDLVDWGLVDLLRLHNPTGRHFTFWDYRLPQAFRRGLGWRLDHIMATAPLAERCKACWVEARLRSEPRPSDHAPVVADFDLPEQWGL